MTGPRRHRLIWLLAVVLTLVSAVWQRLSGPTHPFRATVTVGGAEIRLRLLRSHTTSADQPIRVPAADPSVQGDLRWRRFPSGDDWQTVPLVRQGDTLEAHLPRQPSAGKLQYQLVLRRGRSGDVRLPAQPLVTRFKDDVNTWLLVTHVVFMFASLLFSARAGIGALAGAEACRATSVAFWLWIVGGLALGPAVQKQAFDAWWTGVPFGTDLTDNKTLIAVIAWGLAAWRCRGAGSVGRGRGWILAAAFVTFVVFAIPHSVWGSEIQWDKRV